jgi:hypothetical protein
MKHGHATGHKRETRGASDWYRVHEQATIQRIEQEWGCTAAPGSEERHSDTARTHRADGRPHALHD